MQIVYLRYEANNCTVLFLRMRLQNHVLFRRFSVNRYERKFATKNTIELLNSQDGCYFHNV